MLRDILQGSTVVSILTSLLLFIFGEGAFVASIFFYGPIVTLSFFFSLFSLIAVSLVNIFFSDRIHNHFVTKRLTSWIYMKQFKFRKKRPVFFRLGQSLGLFTIYLVSGPIIGTLTMCFLNLSKAEIIRYTLMLNFIFFLFWVLIYYYGVGLIVNL